jgi:hypothetical protein
MTADMIAKHSHELLLLPTVGGHAGLAGAVGSPVPRYGT